MAYCPECGSEVAPIDTFCAYCGIALQPVAPVAEEPPAQPVSEAPVASDLSKQEVLADASAPEEKISTSEPEISPSSADFTPPTPFILENDEFPPLPTAEEMEKLSDPNFASQDLNRNTMESWSMKTDSIELDAISKELLLSNPQTAGSTPETQATFNDNLSKNEELTGTENVAEPKPVEPVSQETAAEEVVPVSFEQPLETPVSAPTEETPVAESSEDISFPVHQDPVRHEQIPYFNQPVEIPANDENAVIPESRVGDDVPVISESGTGEQNVTPESPVADIAEPISKPLLDLEPDLSAQKDPDFSETIPYTPADYAAHSLQTENGGEKAETPVTAESGEVKEQSNFTQDDEDFKATELYSSRDFADSLRSELGEGFDINKFAPSDPTANVQQPNIQEPAENIQNLPEASEMKLEEPESAAALDSDKSIEIPDTPIPEPPPVTPVFISIQPRDENLSDIQNAVSAPPVAPVKAESAPKEDRPVTNPNIGFGDTDGTKQAKLKPLEEGTILNGRYEIVRKIGGGGMGAVYLASDRNLGGVLRAVKEMIQSSIEDEQQEKAVNDFKREATILSGLEHPAIPTIFDYFFDEKECRFYLVMRYISGGDLAARLRSAPEGKIDEATVTDWGIQVSDVLNYLHNQQPPIVYRDLKPSNIMIDGNTGRIMLIDFGIARLINNEQADVTAVGTMGYAPPELYRKNVEPRSDIFSLGSTMFHLLTGADPQSNPLLIFDFNKHPRPRQINSLLSDQIEQILMRSVELDPTNRFKSAAEMRDILKSHLDNLQKGAVTYGVVAASSSVVQPASNLPVFCGFCGQKIVATDQFCPFCGSQQPTAGQAPVAAQSSRLQQAPVYAAPKATARVLVIGTNDLDAPEFSLDKETNLVGRRDPMSNIFPEVDLSKFDPQTKISRKHARIWRESDVYMLEDLGSSNGTVLISSVSDSVRLLPRQPHVLANGDKIRVGDTTLHFFVG